MSGEQLAAIELEHRLAAKEAEIQKLRTTISDFQNGAEQNELYISQHEEIEQLKKRISWLESGSIHTCHAECDKPLCVANREIEKLQLENESLKNEIDTMIQDYDL